MRRGEYIIVNDHLGARTLILTGLLADMCVLFTAHDTYMRGTRVLVPADCVAAREPADRARALGLMRRTLGADTRPSPRIDLEGDPSLVSPTAGVETQNYPVLSTASAPMP